MGPRFERYGRSSLVINCSTLCICTEERLNALGGKREENQIDGVKLQCLWSGSHPSNLREGMIRFTFISIDVVALKAWFVMQ